MRASIIATITALVLMLGVLAPAVRAQDAAIVSLENEFIRLVVNNSGDETGRFSIRTTGGDPAIPASKDQHLIFGGNAPWTSYTSIRIGNDSYVFGGPTKRRAGLGAKYGKVVAPPELKNGKIYTTCRFGDIEVTQELGFARSTVTRMLDTVGITYRIANTGQENRNVGLRVTLDTMCGTNDGAPIRLGAKEITEAVFASSGEIVDRWFAFDDLAKKTVISMGTLKGGATTPPDRVLFADWGSLADEPWDVVLRDGQGFIRAGELDPDTAAAMFWNPTMIDAGQTKVITTYYGLGYIKDKEGKFTLGIDNPAETTFEHERTQAFTVTAFVKNSGDFDGRNVAITLALPRGLDLLGGNKLSEIYEGMKQGATIQQSWTLKPNGKFNGTGNFKLAVTSANIEGNSLENSLQIHVPTMKLRVQPGAQQVPVKTNRMPTIIPIQLNLSPVENFAGARVVVMFDPAVIRPLNVTRGPGFMEDGRLLAGWDVDDTDIDNGKLVITGLRTNAGHLTQAEINLAVIAFRSVAPGKSPVTLREAVLLDGAGKETPLEVLNGEITVVP
ncbi:MAG: hypothetical protein BWY76_01585 [bacterium ADurb.Bin429]|nr:MAG: hypothetical protein BWY76_01585 [bacterium ADurb.Bin429]